MKHKTAILRFDHVNKVEKYNLSLLRGNVIASSIVHLINVSDLKANPREAKMGNVTDDIIESIRDNPEMFHFKSKGILLSSTECTELERNRYRLSFNDENFEGVLDGGHNLLAITIFMLKRASEEAGKELRGKKTWEEVHEIWQKYSEDILDVKSDFDFLVPVEIIFPSEKENGLKEFEDSILEIAQARNNNAELTEETKANKKGFYEELKKAMDPNLVGEVEWKTNDGGRIKVRDIVALAMIPISKIEDSLPGKDEFRNTWIYSNKSKCVKNYNTLLSSDMVSKTIKGDMRELIHPKVKSAIKLLKDLPALVDLIIENFPDAYNKVSPGYGRISAVKIYKEGADTSDPKYLKRPPLTKYYRKELVAEVPDGFVLPLVWGLSELMEWDNDEIYWVTDPFIFIKEHLVELMVVYHGMLAMAKHNPQGVAKTNATYTVITSQIKSILVTQYGD